MKSRLLIKSGGDTQVAIIDKDGFKSLPRKRIVELYSRYREAIAGGVAKQLRIEKKGALALYPDP